MGVSTNGIAFYGFPIEEWEDFDSTPWEKLAEEDPEGYYEDWDDYYAIKMGTTSNKWKEKRKLRDKCKCTIGTHCSCDYPMYFVAIKHTVTTAYRGYPKRLDISMFDPKEKWNKDNKATIWNTPYEIDLMGYSAYDQFDNCPWIKQNGKEVTKSRFKPSITIFFERLFNLLPKLLEFLKF